MPSLLKCLLIFLSLLILTDGRACGQFYTNQYRPPFQEWQELNTPRFRIVFPADAREEAVRAADILEAHYEAVRDQTGGSLRRFPVILNRANDRSNGFVSPWNFRTEVEIPPIRGKTMNPESGDWLEMVLPHELVHALHMSVNPAGLTALAGLFSPDFRRSVHTAAPLGVLEGVAVHYESHGPEVRGGRGNHAFFVNRFNSVLMSGDPWSMGQLFHFPSHTLPFDRHYAGSYQFVRWLHDTHGDEVMKRAIETHYQWPFLGFGYALRRETGEWPGSLYNSFLAEKKRQERVRLENTGSHPEVKPLLTGTRYRGISARRPLWLDDNRILVHASFYNAPTGFWVYHLDSGKFSLLLEHRSVEDFRYSYSAGSDGALYFADHVADGRYDNTWRANLFRYDFRSGKKDRITSHDRLFAPDPGNPLLALQTSGSANRLVAIDPAGDSLATVAEASPGLSVQEVQRHPAEADRIAVIARKGNLQALWISDLSGIASSLEGEPDFAFGKGSLFDLSWHPLEEKLLFSSDATGTLQIYEYDLERDTVRQVTRSRFNAFEADYSPDGGRIAYILQDRNEFRPVVLDRSGFLNDLPPARFPAERTGFSAGRPHSTVAEDPVRPAFQAREERAGESARSGPSHSDGDGITGQNTPQETEARTVVPYRTGFSWLKPRTFYPVLRDYSDGSRQFGMRLLSTDLLSRHTYTADVSRLHDRYWFEAGYRYSGFHPGFGLTLFNRPAFTTVSGSDGGSAGIRERFLLQNTGAALHVPFHYILENNTRFSSLQIRPEYRISRYNFYLPGSETGSLHQTRWLHTISLNTVLNLGIRQFTRDLQPNAGWVLFARGDLDLKSSPFSFAAGRARYSGVFTGRRGMSAGLYRYLAPAGRWNQTLRLGLRFVSRSENSLYDLSPVTSPLFEEDLFPGSGRLGFLDSRYVIPLFWPDNGGFLIPAYFSNLHVVLFTRTAASLDRHLSFDNPGSMRTAVGAGLKTRVRISNLGFDFGIGFGFEPVDGRWRFLLGQF